MGRICESRDVTQTPLPSSLDLWKAGDVTFGWRPISFTAGSVSFIFKHHNPVKENILPMSETVLKHLLKSWKSSLEHVTCTFTYSFFTWKKGNIKFAKMNICQLELLTSNLRFLMSESGKLGPVAVLAWIMPWAESAFR